MRNANLILMVLLTILSNNLNGQFNPVRPNNEGLFLCSHDNSLTDEEYLNSGFESINFTPLAITFIPKKSLTSLKTAFNAQNKSWMGDTIIFDFVNQQYNFIYRPVKYEMNSTISTPKRIFTIPAELSVGKKFQVESTIEAEVISQDDITWNGFLLNTFTIRLTNDDEITGYNWNTGDIVISEVYGLMEFPNLQYFPYDWKKCVLTGIQSPLSGIQDLSSKDIYRMSIGDQYTAERYYTPQEHYFRTKRCLNITAEDSSGQVRIIERTIYNQSYVDFTWSVQIDTLQEELIYSERLGALHAGELRDEPSTYCRMELPELKIISKVYNVDSLYYDDLILECHDTYLYKHGFDDYFDHNLECNNLPWEDYYLLKHKIVNGVHTGTPLNLDSLVTKNKVINLKDLKIYPNPSNGIFSVNINQIEPIEYFFLVDLSGKRTMIKPSDKSSDKFNFEYKGIGMNVLTAVGSSGNIYNLGKVLFLN